MTSAAGHGHSWVGGIGVLVSTAIAASILFSYAMASLTMARTTLVEGTPVRLDAGTEYSLYRPPYSPLTDCVMTAPDGSAIPLDNGPNFSTSPGDGVWYLDGAFTTTEAGEYSLECGDAADDPIRRYRIGEGGPLPVVLPPYLALLIAPIFTGTIFAVIFIEGRLLARRARRLSR